MNQTKTKYALGRIEQLLAQKKIDLRKKLTTEGNSLTDRQKASLIKQGKVRLHQHVKEIQRYTDVCDVFDFSKFQTEDVLDNKKYDLGIIKLQAAADKAKDEIVLGDEEKAMGLIKEFESI